MTRPHRGRVVAPKDPNTRKIDTSTVRYPGLDHPAVSDEYQEWRESGRLLMPARDTGLAVEGRLLRERRARERQRRRLMTTGVVVAIVAIIAAATYWRSTSDETAARTPVAAGSTTASATPAVYVGGRTDGTQVIARGVEPSANPTPYFARYSTLRLRVPVRPADLTEIGFHQASYSYALHMKSLLPKADGAQVKEDRSSHRDLSKQETGADAVLTGSYVRMWRNRPGEPDTAVDIGGAPGAALYAPVTGTVVKVKKYKLYGKHDDYEIHIRPEGYPTIDVVMIHIADVTVAPGDDVAAGISKLGVIRELSNKEALQLGDYTRGGGDHTHMQLNDIRNPNYEGLKGAVQPNW